MRGQGGREARVKAGRKQGWVRQEETHPSPADGRGWVPAKGVLVMPGRALTSHFWKEKSRAFSSRNRARTYRKWEVGVGGQDVGCAAPIPGSHMCLYSFQELGLQPSLCTNTARWGGCSLPLCTCSVQAAKHPQMLLDGRTR